MTPSKGTALITGGAVRLGKAIATALAQAGYDIALHYNSSAAAATKTAVSLRQLGVQCDIFQLNLQDITAVPHLMQQVRQRFPTLTLLVNSASAYTQATIADTTPDLFDTQINTNLRAPFFLSQAFATQVGQGNIINIIDNKVGFNQFSYAAYLLSKKMLVELTKMAAIEFAPHVRVNAVSPGVVLPASSRSKAYLQWRIQGIPLHKQGSPTNITAAILSLLQNDFMTGQILTVDGGESLTNVGQNAAQFDPDQI